MRRALIAATLFFAVAAMPAHASEWRVAITPYGWLPGVTGNVSTPLPNAGSRTSTLAAADVVTGIDALPIMFAGEVGYGRFSLMGDFMYAVIRQNIVTRDVFYSGGHARIGTMFGTVLAAYRVLDTPEHRLQIAAGLRAWNVDTKLSLNPGRHSGRIDRTSTSWVDPILALRYSGRFTERWGASLYADVGGFDTGSRLTWQVIGSVDYAWSQNTTLRAGWRYLTFERGANAVSLDLSMHGPFFGATFRF